MDKDDIKEEIYKCSKCGLCQCVCPIFFASKNELFLPRGRYNVLNNFYNNSKKISQKFINDLDICLNCNECKNFCPSNINSKKIYTLLKNKYFHPFFPFWMKFKFILLFHSIKKFISQSKLYKKNVKRKKIINKGKKNDVAYFEGCVNKYINNSDKNATINILEQNGYNVVKIIDTCCGLPFLSDGNLSRFDNNIQKIKKSIPDNVDFIVTSCDSCYNTLSDILGDKIKKIDDLIIFSKKSDDAYFYKPCSRQEYNGEIPLINKKYVYTLMENFFILKHPEFAKKIIDKIFFKKEDIENKIIVTSCNLTKWGFINLCRINNINVQVYTQSEYEIIKA